MIHKNIWQPNIELEIPKSVVKESIKIIMNNLQTALKLLSSDKGFFQSLN